MKNDETTRKPAEPNTAEEKASETPTQDANRPRRYEFKIQPVDPKNNFDFEDVADK